MRKLVLEVNSNLVKSDDSIKVGNLTVLFTPSVGEDYWLYRVKLYKDQAVLGFPKFTTIGIGFAKEVDWNTNLPYQCETIEIYRHIIKNKKYTQITAKSVMQAIKMVQDAAIALKEKEKKETVTSLQDNAEVLKANPEFVLTKN